LDKQDPLRILVNEEAAEKARKLVEELGLAREGRS
jgi:hypothetical protein